MLRFETKRTACLARNGISCCAARRSKALPFHTTSSLLEKENCPESNASLFVAQILARRRRNHMRIIQNSLRDAAMAEAYPRVGRSFLELI